MRMSHSTTAALSCHLLHSKRQNNESKAFILRNPMAYKTAIGKTLEKHDVAKSKIECQILCSNNQSKQPIKNKCDNTRILMAIWFTTSPPLRPRSTSLAPSIHWLYKPSSISIRINRFRCHFIWCVMYCFVDMPLLDRKWKMVVLGRNKEVESIHAKRLTLE